jgi:hypothetical protein
MMSLLVLAAISVPALATASAEPETKNGFVSSPTSVPVVVHPNTGGSVAARLAERRMRVARDAKRETFSVSP